MNGDVYNYDERELDSDYFTQPGLLWRVMSAEDQKATCENTARAMGDAELCGTGIEIAAEITVKVSLVKDFELNWPVLETFGPHGKWYVNASAQEFDEALMNVSKEMQRLLMRITGWDAVDTYMYMSVQSDVELSQACKPCEVQLSLRMGTPKLPQFPPLVPQP
mgnify:CR=1 FL=1